MSSEETPAKQASNGLTARDCELLVKAFQCSKDGPFAIDYEKFAQIGGFKNSNSSKASWHGLKKKLDKLSGEGNAIPTPSSTPKSGKRKNAEEGADDADDSPTPAKKAKASAKSKKTPVKAEDSEDGNVDGDEPLTTAPAKKTPAKRSAKKAIKAEADGDDAEGLATPAPKKGKTAAAKPKKAAGAGDAELADSAADAVKNEDEVDGMVENGEKSADNE